MRAREPSTRSAVKAVIIPRMSDARENARSPPAGRACRTQRETSSFSMASSSVNGRPSSRSWVCCAISSDQFTSWASRVPPDAGRSASRKSRGNGKSTFQEVCLRIPSRTSFVRFKPGLLVALLEPVDDAHALVVVLEASRVRVAVPKEAVEHAFPRMSERRVTEVVAERDRLGQILVQAEGPRPASRDLRHLDRMSQPSSKMIAFVRDEDLGLVLEPPEGVGMDDAVAVPGVLGPLVSRHSLHGPARPFGAPAARRVHGQPLLFEPLELLLSKRRGRRGQERPFPSAATRIARASPTR